MQEIKIIGSGVAGLCVAKELSDKGLKVLVIDKTDSPGPQSCSWWAGGMLAPWCEGESTENIVVKLGKESIPWWSKNVDGVIKKGSLVIALSRDEPDLNRFGRRTEEFINVDNDEIGRLEPDLKDRFNKGLYFENEAHLSPRETLKSLKKNLLSKGVIFEKKEFNFSSDLNNNQDLIIDGKTLPAGKYGFFTIPSKKEWTIIFNTNWDQHGKDDYDEKEDVLRFKVKSILSETITEHLEYKVKKITDTQGSISLAWEKVLIDFNFIVKQ